jgi:uncharacterized protein
MKIQIRVQPRARRNELKLWQPEVWKLCLTAPPIDGKANEACVEFFSQGLGISRACVRIVTGHNSRPKLIDLEGVKREEFLVWAMKIPERTRKD